MSIARITIAPAIAALLSAGILVACEDASVQEAFQIEEPVERVEVFVEQGDVAIWTSSASKVRVERTLVGQPGLHVLETRVDRGTLTLEMSCAVPVGCAVDSSLYIPAGVPVEVEVLDGSVLIDGVPQG
ncbi:MAG: hypothetical protein ACI9VR_001955 [Cognaticolwellia sp.]|jgi:hypothetical protein